MSFNVFDISASGLNAQRLRMDATASNLANLNSTRNEKGEPIPYQKKSVVFKTTYESAMNRPSAPSGGYRPAFSSMGNNNMLLKGSVNFDSGNTASG